VGGAKRGGWGRGGRQSPRGSQESFQRVCRLGVPTGEIGKSLETERGSQKDDSRLSKNRRLSGPLKAQKGPSPEEGTAEGRPEELLSRSTDRQVGSEGRKEDKGGVPPMRWGSKNGGLGTQEWT